MSCNLCFASLFRYLPLVTGKAMAQVMKTKNGIRNLEVKRGTETGGMKNVTCTIGEKNGPEKRDLHLPEVDLNPTGMTEKEVMMNGTGIVIGIDHGKMIGKDHHLIIKRKDL